MANNPLRTNGKGYIPATQVKRNREGNRAAIIDAIENWEELGLDPPSSDLIAAYNRMLVAEDPDRSMLEYHESLVVESNGT